MEAKRKVNKCCVLLSSLFLLLSLSLSLSPSTVFMCRMWTPQWPRTGYQACRDWYWKRRRRSGLLTGVGSSSSFLENKTSLCFLTIYTQLFCFNRTSNSMYTHIWGKQWLTVKEGVINKFKIAFFLFLLYQKTSHCYFPFCHFLLDYFLFLFYETFFLFLDVMCVFKHSFFFHFCFFIKTKMKKKDDTYRRQQKKNKPKNK